MKDTADDEDGGAGAAVWALLEEDVAPLTGQEVAGAGPTALEATPVLLVGPMFLATDDELEEAAAAATSSSSSVVRDPRFR